jgi:hypothetical protein
MAGLDQLVSQFLEVLGPLIGGKPPTPRLVAEVLATKPELASRSKQLLGRLSAEVRATGIAEDNRWNALRAALADGLSAAASQAAARVQIRFADEIKAMVKSDETTWLVLVPLAAPSDASSRPNLHLDSVAVRAAVLPMPAHGNWLRDLAATFGITKPDLGERPPSSVCFVTLAVGSTTQAANRAFEQLSDVRDALRFASCMIDSRARTRDLAASEVRRRVEVLLCPANGGRPSTEVIRRGDVFLGVDPAELTDAKKRAWYDRAVRLLVRHPPSVSPKDPPPALRLARSIRLMGRAWVQGSFDVRYLLRLVALETLLNQKEEIADTVADIGARLLATDINMRPGIATTLKDAYDLRSRFVHAGELPSYSDGRHGKSPSELEDAIFELWADLVQRFFAMADLGVSASAFESGLDELRGKTRFKFGTSWNDAFGQSSGS